MPRRRKRRRTGVGALLAVAAVTVALVLGHSVIGTTATAFLAGLATGAAGVLTVARPRLSLRVSTRGTRARPLGRGRP